MIYLILAILGLALGSFINALVWRLHWQSTAKTKDQKAKYAILNGRSVCPNCKHRLDAIDLIPIISWLILKGRCRYCGQPISPQYPLVEAATPLLFIISYIFWPRPFTSQLIFDFGLWLVFLTGLIAVAVYDIRWMLIPNRIIYPLLSLAFIQLFIKAGFLDSGWHLALSSLLSLTVAGGLFYILFQVSQGRWIGGGDVKLGFLLGLILANPVLSMLMLFTASIIGLGVVSPLLITKRLNLNSRLPFGPLLILATIIVKLFGATLVMWYQRHFIAIN